MRSFVDLHCHWVPQIDDGARTMEEAISMLQGLREMGFDTVVATPHMRPGLFDNSRSDIVAAFSRAQNALRDVPGLPSTALSSEHYFDDVVYGRLLSGDGLPYPGGRAVLLEFYEVDFPPVVDQMFFELRRRKALTAVIAHPERYQRIWRSPEVLSRLVGAGAVALLDAATFTGKYGRRAKKSAEDLLEEGLYHAACSDAHRPSDLKQVADGMRWIERNYGPEEVDLLFQEGPREILDGRVDS